MPSLPWASIVTAFNDANADQASGRHSFRDTSRSLSGRFPRETRSSESSSPATPRRASAPVSGRQRAREDASVGL